MADDGLLGPRSNQPKRRMFTADYKLAMIAEYDAATEPGTKGALLRREGLYSSHIIEWWRANFRRGTLVSVWAAMYGEPLRAHAKSPIPG